MVALEGKAFCIVGFIDAVSTFRFIAASVVVCAVSSPVAGASTTVVEVDFIVLC